MITRFKNAWFRFCCCARTKRFRVREDDTFIVSYPRSGSTWVRFLLANLIRFETKTPVNFQSLHEVIPDMMQKADGKRLQTMPSPRIIKTHDLYTPKFKKVIYIVRDGRDVMVSYYQYLTDRRHYQGTFLDFLSERYHWPSSWRAHVESWLSDEIQVKVLLVCYEQLHEHTAPEVKRMARFIDLPCDSNRIEWAIANSSFEHMHQTEKKQGVGAKALRERRFVRRGVVGDWQHNFHGTHKKVFKNSANPILLQLGYVETEDW